MVWLLATITGALVGIVGAAVFDGDSLVVFALVAGEAALILWVLAWIKLRYRLGIRALGWRSDKLGQDAGAGMLAAALALVLEIFILLPLALLIGRGITGHTVEPPKQLPFEDPGVLLLALAGLGVIVLAPLAEELFFRGLLYQAFRRRIGVPASAIFSGLLFAVAHIHPLLFLPIGVLGIILAVVFERRRSIVPNIVGHAVFNSVGFVAILLGMRG